VGERGVRGVSMRMRMRGDVCIVGEIQRLRQGKPSSHPAIQYLCSHQSAVIPKHLHTARCTLHTYIHRHTCCSETIVEAPTAQAAPLTPIWCGYFATACTSAASAGIASACRSEIVQ
jgi:hypothetical protein